MPREKYSFSFHFPRRQQVFDNLSARRSVASTAHGNLILLTEIFIFHESGNKCFHPQNKIHKFSRRGEKAKMEHRDYGFLPPGESECMGK